MQGLLVAGAFAGFVISAVACAQMIRLAPRLGLVDRPAGRKAHERVTPLGGGVGIVLGLVLPLVLALALAATGVADALLGAIGLEAARVFLPGVVEQAPLALTFLAGILVLHGLGLLDDVKDLGPYVKLLVQIAVAAAVCVPFDSMRLLSVLDAALGTGEIISTLLAVLWVVTICNALNFLDNMDGLAGGVAVICGLSLLLATTLVEQWFVAASLAIFVGAVLGFLAWNFPPARIFMGDSGSLVAGFVLGVLSIRGTYLPEGQTLTGAWYALLTPAVALAVPLYDLLVVSAIRLARGKSPFRGDTNHFSHRLVERGMTRRTAVLTIYAVTATTAIAAVLLPQVTSVYAAALIFAQTLLILGVVMILERHPLPSAKPDPTKAPAPPTGEGSA